MAVEVVAMQLQGALAALAGRDPAFEPLNPPAGDHPKPQTRRRREDAELG